MNKLLILAVVSLLPVWRGAGHSRHDGISFWQLLYESSKEQVPHITVEEAVKRARQAYLDVMATKELL